MKEIILKHVSDDGGLLQATFLPENGMNLKSFKKDSIEVIDQSTKGLFDDHMAGLGALIGPHFYHRKDIPLVPDETIFPHISRIKAKGGKEPFSHGIARYVPWNWTASDLSIEAFLSGMDTISGITLAALEGFDFEMSFKAKLNSKGLHIDFFVESEKHASIAGLHYYYALDNNKGRVLIECDGLYNDMGSWKPIPKAWQGHDSNLLDFNLDNASDFGFLPNRPSYTGDATLETKTHKLHIHYKTNSDENAFQLYHPQGASFVCIEPVTAKNPRAAKQKKNHLQVTIEVL